MQPPRTPRYAIGQVMVAIAVLASLLAAPRLVHSPERLVMAAVVGMLTTLALLDVLVEMACGFAGHAKFLSGTRLHDVR